MFFCFVFAVVLVCCLFFVVCLFVGFASLFLWFVLCFWFSCWDCTLDCVQVHHQYFCGYRQLTALHDNLNLLLRSNVCNDLAEAMKALDGKKAGMVRRQRRSEAPEQFCRIFSNWASCDYARLKIAFLFRLQA